MGTTLNPKPVRVFIFLLSGIFCCLGFSGVFCLLFGRGRVLFCAVWAGAQAPPKQQKKITRPRPNSKKKHTPVPSRRFFFCCLGGWVCLVVAVWAGGVFFLLFGRGACSFFCCLGGGRVFFCCLGRGRVFLFCCLGRGACSFFCCLGGGVFFFLLFGPRACFFFAVWAGDGSSLTYRSAWLVFKRPNNKKDQTTKKITRVPP